MPDMKGKRMWLKAKTAQNKSYLEWIRWQPCCACHPQAHKLKGAARIGAGEIAHHYGRTGKGTGQKCSDYETVPICFVHHDEVHHKGRRRFENRYGIRFDEIGPAYREVFNAN